MYHFDQTKVTDVLCALISASKMRMVAPFFFLGLVGFTLVLFFTCSINVRDCADGTLVCQSDASEKLAK